MKKVLHFISIRYSVGGSSLNSWSGIFLGSVEGQGLCLGHHFMFSAFSLRRRAFLTFRPDTEAQLIHILPATKVLDFKLRRIAGDQEGLGLQLAS